jgi:phosphoglycolate phosphatase-like HAD superfamily hydrolase
MANTLTQGNAVFVLDFDGVITTLDIDWKKLRNEISSDLKLKIDTFAEFLEKNFGNDEFERVSELVKQREYLAASKAAPYPDVKPALQLIHENAIHAYIASMQSIEVVNFFLRKFEIDSYFTQVLGRETYGSKRAQLDQIRNIERQQRFSSLPNLVLIDDMKRNIVVAQELGYSTILFKRGEGLPTLVDLVMSAIHQ